MGKNLLPLHPQHGNMDKDRFVMVHTDKWAKDIRLGAFDRKQLETMAAFRYIGWQLIGTDALTDPVIMSTAGDMRAIRPNGNVASHTVPLVRWDGETDRERKMRKAKELRESPVSIMGSANSALYTYRQSLLDTLSVLDWEFMRNPTNDMSMEMQAIRLRLNDIDQQVIMARMLDSLGDMPVISDDDDD